MIQIETSLRNKNNAKYKSEIKSVSGEKRSKEKFINRILIVAIAFFGLFAMCSPSWATNYYASPNGGGDGKTQSRPFKIANFWSVAAPGDVLYLLDGIYTGSSSMIHPPSNLSGSKGAPITVSALNEGEATIDGKFSNTPVKLHENNWFVIEGINVCNAGSVNNGRVLWLNYSDNAIVRRVIGWDADPEENSYIFHSSYSNNNLFEDCAGWGSARKIFSNHHDNNVAFRRCFARWTYYNTAKYNWTGAFTYSYGSTNTLLENCIGTWDESPVVTVNVNTPGIFIDDATSANGGYKMVGCIAYHLKTQTGEPLGLWRLKNRNADTNYRLKDCVGYSEKDIDVFRLEDMAFYGSYLTSMGGGSGGATNYAMSVNRQKGTVNYVIQQDSTSKGVNEGSNFDYIMSYNNALQDYNGAYPKNWSRSVNPGLIAKSGNIIQYGLAENDRPKVNGQSVGAKIQYKYIDGVLTNAPLWPWPMNERIKKAMIQSGYNKRGGLDGSGGTDLTKTIFELGGGEMPATLQNVSAISLLPPSNLRVPVQ